MRAASWCQEPWALCALVFSYLLIKLCLDASFPSHTGWLETLVWATLYCYGWLFMTEPRFLRKAVDQATSWLAVIYPRRNAVRSRTEGILERLVEPSGVHLG